MILPRVYVAGPYSNGDPCQNTHRAVQLGSLLMDRGYAPFIPHLSHFWHTMFPRPYEDWMKLDLAWVSASDVLLRMPGESKGADVEVGHAKERGISVVKNVMELHNWKTQETCKHEFVCTKCGRKRSE